MVNSCCAVVCTNHYTKGSLIHFYRFPADTQKRALWVADVRCQSWTPKENLWLCSTHFIHGKKEDNPLPPDYVPTVFAHTKSPMKRKLMRDMDRFEEHQQQRKGKKKAPTNRQLLPRCCNYLKQITVQITVTHIWEPVQ